MSVDLTQRQYNFSAGPGTLPVEVLEEVRNELPVYDSVGASVMEISHRSKVYSEIHERAVERMRRLLGLDDSWHVLFLQGGASMQFHQIPLNFLSEGATVDYVDTGRWSAKAITEAQLIAAVRGASVNVVGSSKEDDYTYIPPVSSWRVSDDAVYLHFTSNNTVVGTEFPEDPDVDAPLVCDASSDFLSRPMDVERYGLIYAGAQKNIGPAGATAVLIRENVASKRLEKLPTLLDYGTHMAKLFNTPPVFAVYVIEKILAWIEEKGGVRAMQARNTEKAEALYGTIDATDFYRGTVREDSRSIMNVTFRLPSEELEARFISEAAERGLLTLKGHRSVGGVRASIYNAMPIEGVRALTQFMQEFEAANG